MNDLKWFYPESGNECLKLSGSGFRPHGGGTFLIKTSLNIKGLFDVSRVPEYREILSSDGIIHAGSALTYAETASFAADRLPGNFLSAALSSAASTPLRNRITLGGSIAAAPKWTDLSAPLAASDSSVVLQGSENPISYIKYAEDRELRKDSIVSSILIPEKNLTGLYYRFTLTVFDYPFFTIAVSIRNKDTFTAAVNGTKDGLHVFNGDGASIMESAEKELFFNKERGTSAEYFRERALTELKRLLTSGGEFHE